MFQALKKLTNLVESKALASVEPLFKYTVFAPDFVPGEDCAFVSDDWHGVANYLWDDDQVRSIGERDYLENKEGKFNRAECNDWVWDHIEEYAAQAGYRIVKAKE